MQRKKSQPSKKRASLRGYTPQSQQVLFDFGYSFRELDPNNRWVKLSEKIPWDNVANLYYQANPPKSTGRPGLNPRILIGAVIIKHLNDYDDRETIHQIRENIYLQYFLGFSAFTSQAPFDASVFVSIRKKLSPELLQSISEMLLGISGERLLPSVDQVNQDQDNDQNNKSGGEYLSQELVSNSSDDSKISNKGELLMDATVAPQGIAYPTDLNLLNDSREVSELIIDSLMRKIKEEIKNDKDHLDFLQAPHGIIYRNIGLEASKDKLEAKIDRFTSIKKPRTYREVARRNYLNVAQSKRPSSKKIRAGIRKQLGYLNRNLKYINDLLDVFPQMAFPIEESLQRYFWIIQLLYEQQKEMYDKKTHSIPARIVSIHQPHVRPIVRGKAKANTEFGAKIHLSLIDGFSFLDTISWDAFNEGTHLEEYVENYRIRYGFYPKKVLADKIYCTRSNRKWLKDRGIKLAAKPLGRPSKKAEANLVSPGERNPIEGKFGQAKTAYGLNRIRAKLKLTSESWIASIILVLNLVNLTRLALYWQTCVSFSNGERLKTRDFFIKGLPLRDFMRTLSFYMSNNLFLNQNR